MNKANKENKKCKEKKKLLKSVNKNIISSKNKIYKNDYRYKNKK